MYMGLLEFPINYFIFLFNCFCLPELHILSILCQFAHFDLGWFFLLGISQCSKNPELSIRLVEGYKIDLSSGKSVGCFIFFLKKISLRSYQKTSASNSLLCFDHIEKQRLAFLLLLYSQGNTIP